MDQRVGSSSTSRRPDRRPGAHAGARGTRALAWAAAALLLPAAATAADGAGTPLGASLPLPSLLPFALMLAAIAVLPLVAGHWWEHNRNKAIVAAGLALPFAAWFVLQYRDEALAHLEHAALDYLSFMALLGSLFVISGGIHLRGSLSGTPLANTGMLAFGAALANLVGTTGASMVLIRPFLRANEKRRDKVHLVVFFIFVVSNCGGLLTPLGDPPLFLGFLKGVPFTWTLSLWKEWLLVNGLLLVVFNVWDQVVLSREELERHGSQLAEVQEHEPLRVDGWFNGVLLHGVVLVIIAKGQGWGSSDGTWPFGVQEGLMALLAVIGWLTTRPEVRRANRFGFAPIVEVAVLFAGIFVTMVAPLLVLNARGASLGITTPAQYYWATGALSSFLDNAPTYLTFAATAAGQLGISAEGSRYLGDLLALGANAAALLAAISCGAVMMGANTYIGNGPNFMVKAIAEENGVRMPSFFGYMLYSCTILLPIFAVVTWVFFL
jgi:Na+/H+ antiporter NhaD/arsenite permease-like protein